MSSAGRARGDQPPRARCGQPRSRDGLGDAIVPEELKRILRALGISNGLTGRIEVQT